MTFEPRPVVPVPDQPLPPEYLQALGYATAAWNAVRHDLIALFTEVCDVDRRLTAALLSDMRLSEVCHKVRSCALLRGYPERSGYALERALYAIEICRENRIYINSTPQQGGARRSAGKLEESARELHLLGDELWRLRRFLQALTGHLASLRGPAPLPVPDLPPLPGVAREEAIDRLDLARQSG